jgi:hypothetical protein
MNHTLKRNARAERRAKQEKQMIVGIGVVGIVLLLFGVGYAVWSGGNNNPAGFAYGPGDVAQENGFQAVHEMAQQSAAIPFLPQDGPQPRINVSERFYNFGSIGARETVQQTFAIRNDGDAPLTISRAYTTCDCTVANFSARVIEPGQVAEVVVIVDAAIHDSRGQTIRRGVIIENNDRRQPQVEIWVQASVRNQ